MKQDEPASVYEWQVLAFDTTCSPCCAIYALQHHVKNLLPGNEDGLQPFYVENCLHSLLSVHVAVQELLERLRFLLAIGGFEIQQWARTSPVVVQDLPLHAPSALAG